jgi:hypothetical protein
MRCCSCMEHLVSTKLVLGSVPSSQVVPESYVDLAPVRGTNTALTVSSAFCPTGILFKVRSSDEAILYQASRAKNAE